MTRTGPQLYPGADQTHRFQAVYPGDAMEVNTVVLHTTEGRTLPDYDGGAVAPNLTAVPDLAAKRLHWYQHFDIDTSSRALVNLAGGVETNTLNVCQVELVGTCDPATSLRWGSASHVFWPAAPDWALEGVAEFLAWMHDQHGVPLSGPSLWPAYPASYGTRNGARMTNAQWTGFNGICGHLHVPENLHGDPGAIDFARIIALAKGTPTQESDMQLTDQVKLGAWVPKQWPDDKGVADGSIAVNTALGSGYAYARIAAEGTTALTAQVAALSSALGKLAEGAGLDAAEIQAAAEAGAQAALDRLAEALKNPEA